MSSPLSVNTASLAALDALSARIATTPKLSMDEALTRQKAFARQTMQRMMDKGLSFGAANGAMPHLARPDALEWIKAHDNDLGQQVDIVNRALTFWWEHGETIAPHYPNRICVILRKAKEFEREARFTSVWLDHFGAAPHRRKNAD